MNEIVTKHGVRIPNRALGWKFSRSGGPGGQGVNTTDSRVELTCNLSELITDEETLLRLIEKLGDTVVINASTTRSQLQNREDALRRLVDRIERALHVPKARKATRTPRWVERQREESKRRTSELKAGRSKLTY